MLPLPDDPNDPLRLADWLELYAILSPDDNASRGDLDGALRREAHYGLDDDEAIERKGLEVFFELEQRVNAAGEAYPFAFRYGVVQLKSSWQDFPAYMFCLCLSYFGSQELQPRKLFERVSCLAAEGYLQGNAIGFGFPRRGLPASFGDAITALCELIGEGEGYNDEPLLNRKDDKLDLVAWKDFADKRPSKVLIFGQCASGWRWQDKLGELVDPRGFWDKWMQSPPISPTPIRSFFVPHRIERLRWRYFAITAGLFFDRCRIAYWAHKRKMDYVPYIEWVHKSLEQAAS